MTILDTFFILFKSNSQDVLKGMTEVEKKSKETEKSLKNSNEQADALGKSFVKMVESGAAVAGAWAGFQVIKSGVVDITNYNAKLEQTARLSGLSAQNLKILAQASAEAGGDRAGAISNLLAIQASLQNNGLPGIGDPIKWLQTLRQNMKGMSTGQKNARLDAIGLTDSGLRFQASAATDQEFNHYLESSKKLASTSPQDFQRAFSTVDTRAEAEAAIGKAEQTIATSLIPAINRLTAVMTGGILAAGGSLAGSLGLGAGVIAAKGAWGAIKGGVALRALGLAGSSGGGTAAAAEAVNLGGAGFAGEAGGALLGGPVGLALGVGSLGYMPYMAALKKYQNYLASKHNNVTSEASLTNILKSGAPSSFPPSSNGSTEEGLFETRHGSLRVDQILRAKKIINSTSAIAPVSSNTVNVTIGNIDVVTQATNASGVAQGISGSLNQHLANLAANYSDGVKQ